MFFFSFDLNPMNKNEERSKLFHVRSQLMGDSPRIETGQSPSPHQLLKTLRKSPRVAMGYFTMVHLVQSVGSAAQFLGPCIGYITRYQKILKAPAMGYWLVVWNINFIFPYIGNVIIPIDVHIFQRGGPTTNQDIFCGIFKHYHFDMCFPAANSHEDR